MPWQTSVMYAGWRCQEPRLKISMLGWCARLISVLSDVFAESVQTVVFRMSTSCSCKSSVFITHCRASPLHWPLSPLSISWKPFFQTTRVVSQMAAVRFCSIGCLLYFPLCAAFLANFSLDTRGWYFFKNSSAEGCAFFLEDAFQREK